MTETDDPPPCGIYRTKDAIGEVPAGRLVYFHNHGDPGPGIYLPSGWKGNKARFHERGHTLPDLETADSLVRLASEGFYRVVEPFFCCEKECRRFETDHLVQLGYDAAATPILFTPEMVDGAMALPEHGARIDAVCIDSLAPLRVAQRVQQGAPKGDTVH